MSQSLLKILADFTVQLASPVAVGDTTATLTSATDDDGVALPTGLYGLTIDSGQSNKEYIVCTLTGTALTAISTISRQGATTSGFARAHRRGAKVTITDWAILSRMLKNLNGDTGLNASAPLYYDGTATINSANQLATKAYADGLAIAGAGNADTTTQGLVQIATQAEVDAGEDFGTSGAYVVAVPATSRARKYHDYAADSVGTDSYAITITPAITAYATGQEFTFKAGTANTGACTLNVSGLGAKTIKKNYNEDLVTGDIVANQIVKVVYDGTNMQMVSKSPLLSPVVSVYGKTYGDETTQFDITNPSGTTYRYTYDATGTDPGITASTFPTGNKVAIYASANGGANMSAANTGLFTITGSGSNYFEVTNASGIVEGNKTLLGGNLTTWNPTWTKPTGLKYVSVELVGAGGGGGTGNDGSNTGGAGGGAGGYAKKFVIPTASLGTTETVTVGTHGAKTSSFGSLIQATGGTNASGTTQGTNGIGTLGDINSGGLYPAGLRVTTDGGQGASSFFSEGGYGGGGSWRTTLTGAPGSYGSGGGGGDETGSSEGGYSGNGLIIVTEYYS